MGKVSAVGPFTPIVIATRSIVGEKSFNQLRGKGITLHSQVPRARAKALRRARVRSGKARETPQGLMLRGVAAVVCGRDGSESVPRPRDKCESDQGP